MSNLIFWDVQHGHATYVQSPNGRHIVVDLGTGRTGLGGYFSPLSYLRATGVSRLHHLVVTHPHLDHIDDVLSLDGMYPDVFHRPGHLSRSDIMTGVREQDRMKFEAYLALDSRYTAPVGPEHDVSLLGNYGGLTMRVFAPSSCPRGNLNNHSLVVVFVEGETKIVVPGDNETCSIDELMGRPDFCDAVADADVLLAPHHGRLAGTHAPFLRLVNPRLCVVSDGPAGGTSATAAYSEVARGLHVTGPNGITRERYCVTTRAEGAVFVTFGAGSLLVRTGR